MKVLQGNSFSIIEMNLEMLKLELKNKDKTIDGRPRYHKGDKINIMVMRLGMWNR